MLTPFSHTIILSFPPPPPPRLHEFPTSTFIPLARIPILSSCSYPLTHTHIPYPSPLLVPCIYLFPYPSHPTPSSSLLVPRTSSHVLTPLPVTSHVLISSDVLLTPSLISPPRFTYLLPCPHPPPSSPLLVSHTSSHVLTPSLVSPPCPMYHTPCPPPPQVIRELDRERTQLERQEKKLVVDIKKMAKSGQMDAVRIMAKDLVRTRGFIKKFILMRANIQAIALKIQTLKSQAAMANAMKGVLKIASNVPNSYRAVKWADFGCMHMNNVPWKNCYLAQTQTLLFTNLFVEQASARSRSQSRQGGGGELKGNVATYKDLNVEFTTKNSFSRSW